jgi:hypothetical protein
VPYNTTTYNILIASPGDVAAERGIVRDVVYEWNAIQSFHRSTVLLPIGWETHASPEMGAHPQEIINQQIVDRCDLLVGIFWTRLGTPTPTHPSGTVEEIKTIIAAGKPAMLYFSSQPVALDSVDTHEYARLKDFRESCKGRGLYEPYESLGDFRTKLYRHLQLKVNSHQAFSLGQGLEQTGGAASRLNVPILTVESKVILKTAAESDGRIMLVRYIGGTDLQVAGSNLIANQDRREVAKWEDALDQLLKKDLVVARGRKGEFFEITELGYRIADMLSV